MSELPISVLIVEDDEADAKLIREALASARGSPFRLDWVRQLSAALERLAGGGVDVVLLDLALPDEQGIMVFDRVFAAAPKALILVLSAAADDDLAQQLVQRGALEQIIKTHVDGYWLPRALRYVVDRRDARDRLERSEARFRAMSDASPLGIFVSDEQASCVYTNAAYHAISGLSFEQTLGSNWMKAIHPQDRSRVLAEWRAAAMGEEPFQTEYRFLRDDQSVVWTRVSSAPLLDGGRANGRVKTLEDISERKVSELKLRAAEEALFEEKERAQVTLNSIGDAVLSTNRQGNLTYLNRVAEAMTGWSYQQAVGRPLGEVFTVIDGITRQAVANPALLAINNEQIVELASDCVLVRRDGAEFAIEDSSAPIYDRDGQVSGAVIVFHDVSAAKSMALKMTHLAQHDFLTGLPNRALLSERLTQAIRLAKRHRKQVALLFLDIDHFKHINDSLGHAVGDQLLESAARRLVSCVRTTDTVCRQGGDEFVILLAEIEKPRDAALIAEKLLAASALPHLIDGNELHVTLSVGISVYPDDSISNDGVLQNADTAMYHAKANGRNNYQFFKAEMNTSAMRRLVVESSLRRALKREEFVLHYQPQVDLASGAMIGAEALIRWLDPELGLIYPAQFIPVAEECGLIVPIGRWVLRETCRQVKSWIAAGLSAVPVAVNVSAMEFRDKSFLSGLALILDETGLDSRYLELELTESVIMHDAQASASVLEALRAMGVRLAIDDFGTGYSSLSYLQRFPIDTLKIDQSFVRDIVTNADAAAIVNAVIGMGQSLRLRVIAEGVETRQQVDLLLASQCADGQGFCFNPPLAAADFERLLADDDGATRRP